MHEQMLRDCKGFIVVHSFGKPCAFMLAYRIFFFSKEFCEQLTLWISMVLDL
jgi:hypothetical protein